MDMKDDNILDLSERKVLITKILKSDKEKWKIFSDSIDPNVDDLMSNELIELIKSLKIIKNVNLIYNDSNLVDIKFTETIPVCINKINDMMVIYNTDHIQCSITYSLILKEENDDEDNNIGEDYHREDNFL